MDVHKQLKKLRFKDSYLLIYGCPGYQKKENN